MKVDRSLGREYLTNWCVLRLMEGSNRLDGGSQVHC